MPTKLPSSYPIPIPSVKSRGVDPSASSSCISAANTSTVPLRAQREKFFVRLN